MSKYSKFVGASAAIVAVIVGWFVWDHIDYNDQVRRSLEKPGYFTGGGERGVTWHPKEPYGRAIYRIEWPDDSVFQDGCADAMTTIIIPPAKGFCFSGCNLGTFEAREAHACIPPERLSDVEASFDADNYWSVKFADFID